MSQETTKGLTDQPTPAMQLHRRRNSCHPPVTLVTLQKGCKRPVHRHSVTLSPYIEKFIVYNNNDTGLRGFEEQETMKPCIVIIS